MRPFPPLPAQRIARAGFLIALAALGLWVLRGFLPALAWAGVLAVACWPLYARALAAWPRGADVALPALATLAVGLLLLVPLGFVAIRIGLEARSALAWLEAARGQPAPGWVTGLPLFGAEAATWWAETVAAPGAWTGLVRRVGQAGLLGWGREFGGALVHRAVLFAFTLVALFFLFRDGAALAAQAHRVAARVFGPGSQRVAAQAAASVRGTVSGLVLVGLGEGVLLGIAYAVAGVPHPALLGGLTALAAMIPFAAPLVFGVASLLLLSAGQAVAAAVLFGFGMVVLFVADHLVRPALIGGATRLPFLWVLLGILGGVEAFGLLGLFLGPAVMAVLVLVWRDMADPASTTASAEAVTPPPRA